MASAVQVKFETDKTSGRSSLDKCTICLVEFDDTNQSTVVRTPTNHQYCADCFWGGDVLIYQIQTTRRVLVRMLNVMLEATLNKMLRWHELCR